MASGPVSFFLPDEEASARFGAALAKLVVPGDIICLEGDLGAGKTTLARALVRTLMDDPALEVPSPSFSLVQPYETRGQTILHADFYRLADARETDELGLLDDPEAIVIVEWPERAPALKERAAFSIGLAIGANGEGRNASIYAPGRDLDPLALVLR